MKTLRDVGMRDTDRVVIGSNMPTDEFPDILAASNGDKLYRHRDKEHRENEVVYMLVPPVKKPDDPAEPAPVDRDPAVLAMGMVIAEALAKQPNIGEVDDLGDGESIVFMDELPALNITELAEEIIKYQRSHRAALEAEMKVLRDGLEGR